MRSDRTRGGMEPGSTRAGEPSVPWVPTEGKALEEYMPPRSEALAASALVPDMGRVYDLIRARREAGGDPGCAGSFASARQRCRGVVPRDLSARPPPSRYRPSRRSRGPAQQPALVRRGGCGKHQGSRGARRGRSVAVPDYRQLLASAERVLAHASLAPLDARLHSPRGAQGALSRPASTPRSTRRRQRDAAFVAGRTALR